MPAFTQRCRLNPVPRLILIGLFLIHSTNSLAADPVSTGYLDSIAIDGHDTVLYHSAEMHSDHTAVEGVKRYRVEWNNAEWLFASQASADKFKNDPLKYIPQYNGFCSNALALDEGLIRTDGRVWELFGGKLHLFYAERGRQRWLNGDWTAYKAKADSAWETLRKE